MRPSTASPSTKKINEPLTATPRSGSAAALPERGDRVFRAPVRRIDFRGASWAKRRSTAFPTPRLLLVWLVLAGGIGCAVWIGQHQAEPAEIDLLADASSSTLQDTSAEAPRLLSAPAPQTELDRPKPAIRVEEQPPPKPPAPIEVVPTTPPPVVNQTPAPTLAENPTPAPPLSVPEPMTSPAPAPESKPTWEAEPPRVSPALEATPSKPVGLVEEAIDFTRSSHRGDSPMTRNWKMLGLQALLATALTVQTGFADTSGPPTDSEKLDSQQKQLREIQKKLEDLEVMKKDLGTTIVNVAQAQRDILKLQGDIDELKKLVGQIAQDIDAMRKQTAPNTRIANAPPFVAPTGNGRLLLVNEFPQVMEFLVNNTLYRVRPNETRELTLPLGPFSFRVLQAPGFQTNQDRILTAERPYVIRVQ